MLRIYTKTKCNKIEFKGIKFEIGDSIEIINKSNSNSNQSNSNKIGIIKEI